MPKLNVIQRENVDAKTIDWRKQVAIQVNALSEGRAAAFYQATTAAPTTGTWAQGDYVQNSAPTELGGAGNKYTIAGWRCVAAGTPGTWVQARELTGN